MKIHRLEIIKNKRKQNEMKTADYASKYQIKSNYVILPGKVIEKQQKIDQ